MPAHVCRLQAKMQMLRDFGPQLQGLRRLRIILFTSTFSKCLVALRSQLAQANLFGYFFLFRVHVWGRFFDGKATYFEDSPILRCTHFGGGPVVGFLGGRPCSLSSGLNRRLWTGSLAFLFLHGKPARFFFFFTFDQLNANSLPRQNCGTVVCGRSFRGGKQFSCPTTTFSVGDHLQDSCPFSSEVPPPAVPCCVPGRSF